jgi:SsrA-binding protein
MEAGIVLFGTEIKSIRANKVNLNDAFARIDKGEAWLIGAHIAPWESTATARTTSRSGIGSCCLHRSQIDQLLGKTKAKGLTLVPLKLYITGAGKAKVELGLGKGKQQHDRRREIQARTRSGTSSERWRTPGAAPSGAFATHLAGARLTPMQGDVPPRVTTTSRIRPQRSMAARLLGANLGTKTKEPVAVPRGTSMSPESSSSDSFRCSSSGCSSRSPRAAASAGSSDFVGTSSSSTARTSTPVSRRTTTTSRSGTIA